MGSARDKTVVILRLFAVKGTNGEEISIDSTDDSMKPTALETNPRL